MSASFTTKQAAATVHSKYNLQLKILPVYDAFAVVGAVAL